VPPVEALNNPKNRHCEIFVVESHSPFNVLYKYTDIHQGNAKYFLSTIIVNPSYLTCSTLLMSDIAKPKVAFVMPTEPEEDIPKAVDSMQPKSDSHMAIKVSPPVGDYFSADSRSQAGEEDHLISRDNTDLEAKKPKATGLRSRKVIIAIVVVAVLLIVGAIICKFFDFLLLTWTTFHS
jgi:hypothetical protein